MVKHNTTLNTKLNNIYVYINYSNSTTIKMKCNTAFMLVIRANNTHIPKLSFSVFLYCLENALHSYCTKSEVFMIV